MIFTFGTTPALARSMIFDRLTLDAVNRARDVRVSAAGKSVNVARVLKTLGHAVTCAGLVGGDTGRAIVNELSALNIGDAWVRDDQPTRVCVTVIDQATRQATELIEEAPPAKPGDAERLLDVVERYAPICSVIVASGTLAPGLPDDLYARLARRALDVNPRVKIILDAKGQALSAAAALPVIVKCNAHELRETFSGSTGEAIGRVLSLGAESAVITDGLKPTTIATGAARWTIDTPIVPVVSPIGSGDALAGGVAAGIEKGWELIDAARFGVACAASNAESPIAGMIDPSRVEKLFAQLRAIRR